MNPRTPDKATRIERAKRGLVAAAIALTAGFGALQAQRPCVSEALQKDLRAKVDAADNKPRRWLAAADSAGAVVVIVVDDSVWSTATAIDAKTGGVFWRKPLAGSVRQLAVSPDGSRLAFAYSSVLCPQYPHSDLWDMKKGVPVLAMLGGWMRQQGIEARFSADSKTMAGSVNGQVLLYDAASGLLRRTITPPGFETRNGIERIDRLVVNSRVVSGSNPGGNRYTWDVRTGKMIRRVAGSVSSQSGDGTGGAGDTVRVRLVREVLPGEPMQFVIERRDGDSAVESGEQRVGDS